MKTPANHPWKQRSSQVKVKARCMACNAEYDRDPESRTKTCSEGCYRQYSRVKHAMHTNRG